MLKSQKHRLVLLLGILVALVFFYLGLNTWMSSQGQTQPPPPVVRATPPVQIEPPAKPVKPEVSKPAPPEPEPATQQEAPKPQVIEVNKPPAEPKKTEAKEEKKPKVERKVKAQKKEVKPKREGKLKEYVVQIGAFKSKEKATEQLESAKRKGFEAFVIEEGLYYKVRVKVKAESILSALREVRSEFRNAFAVR